MKVSPRILRTGHTHLYPGARLHGEAHALRRGQALDIEFADLGRAAARVESVDAPRATLSMAAHRTARGSAIVAKRWLIESAAPGTWRVLRRLALDG